MLLISPRKPGSNWSKDNRDRVKKLEAEGRMHLAGHECLALAKRDGSWERLKQTETGEAPLDLARALEEAGASDQWDAFSLSVRRRSLELLLAAKLPQTRANRIERIVKASVAGEDPTLWRPKAQ
ncbi:YdeI family protein [Erythrobacter sp. KY5]|uniref:YdeI/OmpD-associated family protein n=1 Tax=Erythrobacter sp. KY5 TaxID=2011159 RepID=UPI0018F8B49C|nr:YdeI/OmpD-associated family protein [Erythrobacter sp. KY5]